MMKIVTGLGTAEYNFYKEDMDTLFPIQIMYVLHFVNSTVKHDGGNIHLCILPEGLLNLRQPCFLLEFNSGK